MERCSVNRKFCESREDVIDHITKLCDLEWNGAITIKHFRDRVQDVISKYEKKENDNG